MQFEMHDNVKGKGARSPRPGPDGDSGSDPAPPHRARTFPSRAGAPQPDLQEAGRGPAGVPRPRCGSGKGAPQCPLRGRPAGRAQTARQREGRRGAGTLEAPRGCPLTPVPLLHSHVLPGDQPAPVRQHLLPDPDQRLAHRPHGLLQRHAPVPVRHLRAPVPRLPHLGRLRRVLLRALPARRPALAAHRHAGALPHPGLHRARLGGPHLLFALQPLPNGEGTEDPRIKKCLLPPPSSFPSGLLSSAAPSWEGLPSALS